MSARVFRNLTWLLWLGAALLIASSMHYMFQAGCAGDLKGGALGDRGLALDHEGMGILLAWVAIAVGMFAISMSSSLSIGQRLAACAGFLALSAVGLTIAGMQFEVWGVQACF